MMKEEAEYEMEEAKRLTMEAHKTNVAAVEARLQNEQDTNTKVSEERQLLHSRNKEKLGKERRGYDAVIRNLKERHWKQQLMYDVRLKDKDMELGEQQQFYGDKPLT